MYELIQLTENTYYINSPSKIGIYKINQNQVYIIDSGNDKEAGKKIQKILSNNNWTLKAIINTHSNADHIGGNHLLQEKTSCPIYSYGIENAFINNPILEPSFLYGGYPCKIIKNKFLMASASISKDISELLLAEGMEIIPLKGHFFDMIGVKTPDNIYFLADCIFGENTINKYHIFFIYDVNEYLKTLDKIETLNAKYFVPAHSEASENIKPIIELNRKKVYEIIYNLLEICKEPTYFENILKKIFDIYSLKMDFNQYVLVGSTIRSYLSYLYEAEKININFYENKLLWHTI